MLRFVTACIHEIAATLARFTAYCAILGGALFGGWLLLNSLFVPEEAKAPAPPNTVAVPAHWIDRTDPPLLRRISE